MLEDIWNTYLVVGGDGWVVGNSVVSRFGIERCERPWQIDWKIAIYFFKTLPQS